MPTNTENGREPEQMPENMQEEAAEEQTVQSDAEAALRSELEQALAQKEEYLNLAQRVQADFENFRRRNESARADAYAEGQRSVAAAFLDVLDNLERATDVSAAADADSLKSGVELTLRQMRDAYAKLGVAVIDRQGEPFDPALENAVLQGSTDDGAPGTVCQVLQKGYQMNGTVLRHAMVKVVPEE